MLELEKNIYATIYLHLVGLFSCTYKHMERF